MHILSLEACTPATLAQVLGAAGVAAQADGERVRIDLGYRVQLLVSRDHRFLRLLAHFLFQKDAPHGPRLELANRINAEMALPRAAIDSDGDLALDHTLVLGPGLSAEMLVAQVEALARALPLALGFDTQQVLLLEDQPGPGDAP